MDSLLSHVDARWQLVPVEFHYRGSINVEPIPVIMDHRWSLRAQSLLHGGICICIWRTGKGAPVCRGLSSSSVIHVLLLLSARWRFPVSDLAESGGFLGGNRESGERSLSGHQTGYRLEQEQLQCQNQTSPAEEERDVAPV